MSYAALGVIDPMGRPPGYVPPLDFRAMLQRNTRRDGRTYLRVRPEHKPLVIGAIKSNWRDPQRWPSPAGVAWTATFEPMATGLSTVVDEAMAAEQQWITAFGDPTGWSPSTGEFSGQKFAIGIASSWPTARDALAAFLPQELHDQIYVIHEGADPASITTLGLPLVEIAVGAGIALALGTYLVKRSRR